VQGEHDAEEEVAFLFKIGSKMIVSVRRLVQKIKIIVKRM